jgi:hypothetical protein
MGARWRGRLLGSGAWMQCVDTVCRDYQPLSQWRCVGDFLSQNGLVRQLGYTRVSTSNQDAGLQLDALVAAGVQKRDVFADVTSGS